MGCRLESDAAREILSRYPISIRAAEPLGGAGGFSGASLWRVESEAGRAFCLRAWPEDFSSSDRLDRMHGWMGLGRAAGHHFVPEVVRNRDGQLWICAFGRLWDVTEWMPGRADYRVSPSRGRLESACAALAQLHLAWARWRDEPAGAETAPAIRRRLSLLSDWETALRGGWRPELATAAEDPAGEWSRRAWRLLGRLLPGIRERLNTWQGLRVNVQPCLCDVWRDNVLFESESVSGIVDYGSAKIDHVAVDLARLLGSLAGNDTEWRAWGLAAYSRQRPLSEEDHRLVALLDETGTLLGIANWLLRLYRDRRAYSDRDAVARRLGELVERIEQWDSRPTRG